jgi:hypothetical protein
MSNRISEARVQQPVGDAAALVQKKARQLVYDARYEVKGILGNKKVDPVSQERMILQRIAKSTSSPAVKAMARQMVSKKRAAVKEDFVADIQETATDNVVKALFKVFVEGVEAPQIENSYLEELAASGEKKYKIRVTDTKTGNSYVRYATREKISQLRAQGLKVELTEYGEPREGEKKRGEDTARAKKATKLDPVGKEDGDVDNDGDRDKSDKYLMKRRKAIGSAIEKRQTVSASYEPEGEALDEMRRPKFRYNNNNNKGNVKSPSHHPGRGGGSQNPQARFNAPSSPNPSTTSSDSSNGDNVKEAVTGGSAPNLPAGVVKFVDELPKTVQNVGQKVFGAKTKPTKPEVQEAHKPGHKKHKKTTEPRWQDSDGDGKWYEPEDVKKEDYVWTEAKTKEEKTNGTVGVDNYTSGAIKLFPQEEDGVKTPSVRLSINSSFEAEGPIITEKALSKAQQRFFGMVRATQKGEMEAPSPEVASAAKSMKKKDVKDFASTEHEGLPEKKKGKKKRKKVVKEAAESAPNKEEEDPRAILTYRNLLKNKLRAMGAKNPMVLGADDEKVMNIMTKDKVDPIVMVASEQHRPPAGWKSSGGGSEDKPIKSQFGNRFAGDDIQGGWEERERKGGKSQVKPAN